MSELYYASNGYERRDQIAGMIRELIAGFPQELVMSTPSPRNEITVRSSVGGSSIAFTRITVEHIERN